MNWILLILAGCLELVFTFCLGKINRVVGAEKYMWSLGLLISLCVSMLPVSYTHLFKGTLRSFKRNGMLVGEEATKPLKGVNEFLFCLYRFPGLLYFMKGKELLI